MTDISNAETLASGGAGHSGASSEGSRRVDDFKAEVADLNLKGSSAGNERYLMIAGIALLVIGAALGILGGIQASGTTNPADQRAFVATASLVGIVLAIVGVGLFLRYSLARYLRFWMLRLVYENQAQTDRQIEALERIADRLGK